MKHPCLRNAVACVMCTAALSLAPTLKAQQRGVTPSSAVDARGIRYRASNNAGLPPWIADAVRKRRPDYPYKNRTQRNEGSGLFRLTIDLKTGSVTNIDVVQSTGFPGLDESAINAFRDWRWKPGKWKEVDIPITFTFNYPTPALSGSTHGGGSMGPPDR